MNGTYSGGFKCCIPWRGFSESRHRTDRPDCSGSRGWRLLSLISFLYTSYIRTRIKVMGHWSTSFQEMEREISSLSMKTQGIYRPPDGWTGKKSPFTSLGLKLSTERRGNPWSLSLNSSSRSTTSTTMSRYSPRRSTRPPFPKCLMSVSELWPSSAGTLLWLVS